MKLSDYVTEKIVAQGVSHVFLVPGGGAMHLDDSAGHTPGLSYVCNLHEQAAAIAAEAYAKASENLGFALVTTGPGGTNAVTGVAGAWLDSTPCIFVSGQVKREDLVGESGVRQFGFQEIDIVSIVKSITKYAITVIEPDTIRYHLEKALYLATHGRPGPVWIDIPLDVQAAEINPDLIPGYRSETDNLSIANEVVDIATQVSLAIDLLNQAERPIIWGGNGIRLAHAKPEFRELCHELGIPLLLTWLGIDLLPDDDPLLVGRPGSVAPRGANFALQNSDWLLTLGARLDMGSTGYSHENLARSAKKIMVDIDPAEIHKMRTPVDLPIAVDAKVFLTEMLRQKGRIQKRDRSAWLARCRDWKEQYPVVQPEYYEQTDYVSTYVFTDALSKVLHEDALVVTGSSGAGIEIFLLTFRAKAGQRVLHTASLGAMGFGLPASIGACLAFDAKPTVLVDADGGFQLNSQELETVARLHLPIKIFILNNQGYASIRTSQNKYFNRLTGADATSGLTLPDARRLAAAYGIPAASIRSQEHLQDRIIEILHLPGPFLCDVIVPPDEPRVPSLSSVQGADGRMVSRPMEDLYPFLERSEFRRNMLIHPIDE
jgi:acetolactate synthase-1/2/3 large subunit